MAFAYLYLVGEPVFSPSSAVVTVVTTVVFGGGSSIGDLVLFTQSGDCSITQNNPNFTATNSPLFVLDSTLAVTTSSVMDAVGSFKSVTQKGER